MDQQSLAKLPMTEFLDELGSSAPTPGGGAAAALAGALAAGLGRMVCALTVGKPRFAQVEPQIRELATRFGRADLMFRRLLDEDVAAYGELSAAFKLDKAEPTRRERVAQAAALAAAVPLEAVAVSHRVLADLERLARIGNPNVSSDVEAAQHVARAALRAAAANVRVNLAHAPEPDRKLLAEELARFLRDDH